jgi:hypothetical protein
MQDRREVPGDPSGGRSDPEDFGQQRKGVQRGNPSSSAQPGNIRFPLSAHYGEPGGDEAIKDPEDMSLNFGLGREPRLGDPRQFRDAPDNRGKEKFRLDE